MYTYIYIYLCIRKPQCHLCSDRNLELQLVLDALSPQVSKCPESTDKDLDLGIFACSRDRDPRCFGRVLWYSQLVCFSSGLASQSYHLCVSVSEKGIVFIVSVMKKWEHRWNTWASVCIYKYTYFSKHESPQDIVFRLSVGTVFTEIQRTLFWQILSKWTHVITFESYHLLHCMICSKSIWIALIFSNSFVLCYFTCNFSYFPLGLLL